ncbi:MAG: hypothetical protein HUK20_15270, partial [Fibrobacter sp.]|nr:hypothetical protein [Fibrobacter sp.]
GYDELDEFAEGCSDLWDHDGVKYCVGSLKKDTVLSYNDRIMAGMFVKNDIGESDSLWNTEIEGADRSLWAAALYKNSFVCYINHYFKIDYDNLDIIFDH